MLSLLILGFIIGMRHALEADHFAAMAAINTSEHSTRQALRQGLAWGIGAAIVIRLY